MKFSTAAVADTLLLGALMIGGGWYFGLLRSMSRPSIPMVAAVIGAVVIAAMIAGAIARRSFLPRAVRWLAVCAAGFGLFAISSPSAVHRIRDFFQNEILAVTKPDPTDGSGDPSEDDKDTFEQLKERVAALTSENKGLKKKVKELVAIVGAIRKPNVPPAKPGLCPVPAPACPATQVGSGVNCPAQQVVPARQQTFVLPAKPAFCPVQTTTCPAPQLGSAVNCPNQPRTTIVARPLAVAKPLTTVVAKPLITVVAPPPPVQPSCPNQANASLTIHIGPQLQTTPAAVEPSRPVQTIVIPQQQAISVPYSPAEEEETYVIEDEGEDEEEEEDDDDDATETYYEESCN